MEYSLDKGSKGLGRDGIPIFFFNRDGIGTGAKRTPTEPGVDFSSTWPQIIISIFYLINKILVLAASGLIRPSAVLNTK